MHVVSLFCVPSFSVLNLRYFEGIWFLRGLGGTQFFWKSVLSALSPGQPASQPHNQTFPCHPRRELGDVLLTRVLNESFRSLAITWTIKGVRASLRIRDWTLLSFPYQLCSSAYALSACCCHSGNRLSNTSPFSCPIRYSSWISSPYYLQLHVIMVERLHHHSWIMSAFQLEPPTFGTLKCGI